MLFLRHDILLLPNMHDASLDIFRIPESVPNGSPVYSFQPVMALCLPAMSDESQLLVISCRAEPNPRGTRRNPMPTASRSSSQYEPSYRFSANSAIAIFNMYMFGPAAVSFKHLLKWMAANTSTGSAGCYPRYLFVRSPPKRLVSASSQRNTISFPVPCLVRLGTTNYSMVHWC